MNRRIRLFLFLSLFGIVGVTLAQAQDEPSGPPPQQGPGQAAGREGGPRPLFGKITAIRDGVIDIAGPDGQAVTVKLTAQTEFRKDRETAKVSDFNVGDTVMVRGDENPDHTVTARIIGTRTGGPGGRPGAGMMMVGTLGKDYVAGEVKSIDAPKITVLRTDNVTQVLELNEETSLRRGRDSITMADIKVGDHVMARGAVLNDTFVPKGVMVMSSEQWQRMQERMSEGNAAKPDSPASTAPKPQE